jgi:hypothetical protein
MMTNLLLRPALARLARPAAVLALVLTTLGPGTTPSPSAALESQQPYLVSLGGNAAVKAARPIAEIEHAQRERERASVMAELAKQSAAGKAAEATYEESEHVVRVKLTESARAELLVNPNVASVELASGPRASAQATDGRLPLSSARSAQAVSSVSFVQVYTPFVWGRTSVNGLSVALTLEDSAGTLKGVAIQTTKAAPNNYVKVDRTQLYYETLFVDPSAPSQTVTIMPSDRVRVVTTGVDPTTNRPGTDDRRIIVDDVRAWSSIELDKVGGSAPAGSSITITSGPVAIGSYLTPGSNLSYVETTAGADGLFAVDKFRTSTSPTTTKPNIVQGSTGFVRVRHSDGNEVYTVHGQTVFVPENSPVVHGWAFPAPSTPTGLETGVALNPRPAPPVVATLKTGSGQVKDTATSVGEMTRPWPAVFKNADIAGGDIVEVSIWGAPPITVNAGRLTAAMQTGNNTIIGSGPANTQMVLGAGKLQGYMMSTSYFDYLQQRVATDGAGNFASPQFKCGTTNHLTFRPGSFGYVGYEDARGNFIYMSIAVPTNQVMADYPFMEGWIADGSVRPSITIQDASGATKQQATASPMLIWLINQKLYNNAYYQLDASQFIVPGDTVLVTQGAWSSRIPVDRVTAWVDTDSDSVVGEAPAGAKMRVIPAGDRASRSEVTSGGDGQYRAGNPFTQVGAANCADTPKTFDFVPGDSGRAYVEHGDNNEVFAAYGRSIHVNQNENYVELFQFDERDLDWHTPPPQRIATVTLKPRQGAPLTVQQKAEYGRPGKTKVTLLDGQGQRVLIRAGDSITATFDEGPDRLMRSTSMEVKPQALVTGSPDTDTGTLAGVGPRGWMGRATLNPEPKADGQNLPMTGTSAYAPVRFSNSSGPVSMVRGYSGTVSFTNTLGQRVWTAWAVAAVPVKITGMVLPGDGQVCGTGPAGTTVRIHDVTTEGQDLIVGSGTIDAGGKWCVAVSTLKKDQVILAEADGVYSQPVVIGGGNRIFIALTTRAASAS